MSSRSEPHVVGPPRRKSERRFKSLRSLRSLRAFKWLLNLRKASVSLSFCPVFGFVVRVLSELRSLLTPQAFLSRFLSARSSPRREAILTARDHFAFLASNPSVWGRKEDRKRPKLNFCRGFGCKCGDWKDLWVVVAEHGVLSHKPSHRRGWRPWWYVRGQHGGREWRPSGVVSPSGFLERLRNG